MTYRRPGCFESFGIIAWPGGSAFRNRDGSIVVEAINTAATAQPVGLQVPGQPGTGPAAAYLTDATHSLAPESPAAAAQAPPRSLTTWVIPAHERRT